ncbi:hypothetical protein ACIO87_01465 [Streptomyces sp. NPDC087218]|uniref:hypothetical protein n=1 Tax=Streptomyces sp. NPDC087218 TaxID=3365769 RepID=UPI00380539E5
MTVPGIIPIKHEADYRTDTIGRWRDGQFFASVTGAFPEDWSFGDDWQEQKRWCAVLHRFDAAGRHLDSRIRVTGTTAGGEREAIAAARLLLDEWLEDLPERHYEDIAIAPFAVRSEGILFGLVVEEGDGADPVRAEFLPDSLGFFAPWDGYYDT